MGATADGVVNIRGIVQVMAGAIPADDPVILGAYLVSFSR